MRSQRDQRRRFVGWLVQVWKSNIFISWLVTFFDYFLFFKRMAQAVVLQSEILAKDVSAIDALWIDALKNQERFQFSYSAKIHELVEAIKRRQNFPAVGEVMSSESKVVTDNVTDCNINHRNVNQGWAVMLYFLSVAQILTFLSC